MTAPTPVPAPLDTPDNAPAESSISPTSPTSTDDAPVRGGTLIDASEAAELPTSFGVFKPVGHVMMGLPTQAQLDALVTALHGAGWHAPGVRQFSPSESTAELRAMIDNAGVLAAFGYEIVMLERYLALAEAGTRWLLVRAADDEQAVAAADLARTCGATLAVHYKTLTVEELLT